MPNRKIINGEPYRYAYQGQEKDPETGKEAFQLRLWDGRIGRWLTTDPKREFDSPYLGMGNRPTVAIDPDGGDIIILNANNEVGGLGHIAVLIGNDTDGWTYHSKNGTESHGLFGKSFDGDYGDGNYSAANPNGNNFIGTKLTAKEVMLIVNERYKKDGHSYGYENYIKVKASTEQDNDARIAANKQVHSYYSVSNLVWSGFENCAAGSCLDVAQDALRATKKDFKSPNWSGILPNDWFINFGWNNNNRMYNRVPRRATIEVGDLIKTE